MAIQSSINQAIHSIAQLSALGKIGKESEKTAKQSEVSAEQAREQHKTQLKITANPSQSRKIAQAALKNLEEQRIQKIKRDAFIKKRYEEIKRQSILILNKKTPNLEKGLKDLTKEIDDRITISKKRGNK